MSQQFQMAVCEDNIASLLSSYLLWEKKSREYMQDKHSGYLGPPLSAMKYMAREF